MTRPVLNLFPPAPIARLHPVEIIEWRLFKGSISGGGGEQGKRGREGRERRLGGREIIEGRLFKDALLLQAAGPSTEDSVTVIVVVVIIISSSCDYSDLPFYSHFTAGTLNHRFAVLNIDVAKREQVERREGN
jgi:hypothetical protein